MKFLIGFLLATGFSLSGECNAATSTAAHPAEQYQATTAAHPPEQTTAAYPPEQYQPKRLAQLDTEDTYDPFADYSEFDEAQEEEADINFFRHGRFVTIGFMGGVRGFTQGMGEMYSSASAFGLFLSYFFDLRFAMQFSYLTSDHNFRVVSNSNQVGRGTIGIANYSLDFKYYVNTQNVTKGLGKFNPYLIGGFARVDRTTTIADVAGFGKAGTMGFNFGLGIEIPMMRNKMFFGAQAMYQLINFKDENTEVVFDNNDRTGKFPNGDSYTGLAILGVNF